MSLVKVVRIALGSKHPSLSRIAQNLLSLGAKQRSRLQLTPYVSFKFTIILLGNEPEKTCKIILMTNLTWNNGFLSRYNTPIKMKTWSRGVLLSRLSPSTASAGSPKLCSNKGSKL